MKINEVYLKGQDKVTGWNNPNKIIIHHPEYYGSVQGLNDVMRNMDFTMIGYNYYVRKDGSVWKGRPDNVTSGNCYGQNNCSLGVCFEGNYDKDKEMPQAQFNAGVELIKYLKSKYGIKEVNGHKKYNNTDCPGRYFPLDRMLKAINSSDSSSTGRVENIQVSQNPGSSTSKKLWEVSISGEEVKSLQREFNKQCGAGLTVDGYFGDSTLNACITVREGARGNITKLIQQRLLNRGYTSLKEHGGADGVFGAGTTQAIKNLQKNKGLVVDGIVGKNTWKALYSK
ncbi:N-acetylmuramoyl-L-alanine amidase [Clostridium baratii]|uniref:peptidoglycan recognition protein family protein n=1 Tax=Clostridium baratii TaxID=1561 RepID=UPI0030D08D25